MNTQLPKRFYRSVAAAQSSGGYSILLDGKPAKVGSAHLRLPTPVLAEAIAEEWRGQENHLDPACMRLTGLAASALNRVAANRGEIVEHILAFGRNDILCYRAAEPPELVARQKQFWDPMLAWAHERHKIRLMADCGISFVDQPVDALLRMQEIASGFDNFGLAAFDAAASLTASFVLALALVERHIRAEDAFAISHLDERHQAEKWGHDPEAEARRKTIDAELAAVERFVSLLA